jgi:hypothetical protein
VASFLFLPDKMTATMTEAVESGEIVPPTATRELGPPTYPPRPLAAQFGDATVAVRIIVGTDGLVGEILDSPLMKSTPGPFAEDFRDATEEAVRSWRFEGAQLRTLKEGEDLDGDGTVDYHHVVSAEPVPVYLDIRFDFKIVDGHGIVRPASPASGDR